MFYPQIWSQVTVWYSFIKTVIFQIGSHSVKIIIIIYQALWHCLGVVLLAVGYFLKLPNSLRVYWLDYQPLFIKWAWDPHKKMNFCLSAKWLCNMPSFIGHINRFFWFSLGSAFVIQNLIVIYYNKKIWYCKIFLNQHFIRNKFVCY